LKDFVKFLQINQQKLSKLKILKLQLRRSTEDMTARSMMAILQNSNLDEFVCLSPLPLLTTQEQVIPQLALTN
jgi:hypothetical protein